MRRPVWAAAAAVVLLAGLAAGLLANSLSSPRSPDRAPQRAEAAVTPGPSAAPSVAPDRWWKPLPAARGPFVPAQLVIDRLHVLAPIEVKGIDEHNVMEAPDRAADAAWYRFTALPGAGSNAVFAGHRDFGRVGNPAIFWHLDQLVPGDLIEVVSAQQTELRYRVTQTWDYSLTTIPMAKVLATDPSDEVTLITCAGDFQSGLGYDQRLVVRAVRTA
jgi:LPXTG-site transpeptidase (sortase) family protein